MPAAAAQPKPCFAMTLPFEKMHGLGNDFVIIDQRHAPMQLQDAAERCNAVRQIADRRTGIGCDQLVVLRPSSRADTYMQIYNADGGEVAACGNATRCVAWLLMREARKDAALIETEADMLECRLAGRELVSVNMGIPRTGWRDIPLACEADTLALPLERNGLGRPVGVNVGNPHAIYFVADTDAIPLAELGPALEHDPLFPGRANISVAMVEHRARIRLRTWERGVGETPACGTAGCAAAVAARRLGLCDSHMEIVFPGGLLEIVWEGGEGDFLHDVWMTGPVAHIFSGELKTGLWI